MMRPVLIIEDDAPSREAYATLIQSTLGYDVVTADGGGTALDLLRSGLRPGIIVLDLSMPDIETSGVTARRPRQADAAVRSGRRCGLR